MHEVLPPDVLGNPPPLSQAVPPPFGELRDAAAVPGHPIVYAGFWKRVAATIIDGLFLSAIDWLLSVGILVFGGHALSIGAIAFLQSTIGSHVVAVLVPLRYTAGMHASTHQATFGKMAVGIKVVASNGARISFLRAVGRYFASILSWLLLGIGLIMAGVTERKQALHDFLCDTLVVDQHAFTARPELQRPGLGGVAITVLVLAGLLMLVMVLP